MSDLTPLTESERLTLQYFSMFGNDPAAVTIAKQFVGTSMLNFQLLQMSVSEASSEAKSQVIDGKVDHVVVANKAVQLAKNKLTAFE